VARQRPPGDAASSYSRLVICELSI
jgi:hypothetical protein